MGEILVIGSFLFFSFYFFFLFKGKAWRISTFPLLLFSVVAFIRIFSLFTNCEIALFFKRFEDKIMLFSLILTGISALTVLFVISKSFKFSEIIKTFKVKSKEMYGQPLINNPYHRVIPICIAFSILWISSFLITYSIFSLMFSFVFLFFAFLISTISRHSGHNADMNELDEISVEKRE